MKLEQDLPTSFERLYFFKIYELILKTTLSIDFNGVVTQKLSRKSCKMIFIFVCEASSKYFEIRRIILDVLL